jgi:hypothetical protein
MLVCMLALGLVFTACPTDSGGGGTNNNGGSGGGGDIKITGTAKVGETLTATYDGEIQGAMWWEYGKDDTINGPNGKTYVIQPADVGKKIRAACFNSSNKEIYSDFVGPVTN